MKHEMRADDEYRRLLKVMDRDPTFTHDEIEMFKATELVRKSIDLVKKAATREASRRHSPELLKYVESRVAKNIGIQKSLSPVNSKSRSRSRVPKARRMKELSPIQRV